MIIIFGLENVLVIVKAVVSTRGNKDVKLKIAEGTCALTTVGSPCKLCKQHV